MQLIIEYIEDLIFLVKPKENKGISSQKIVEWFLSWTFTKLGKFNMIVLEKAGIQSYTDLWNIIHFLTESKLYRLDASDSEDIYSSYESKHSLKNQLLNFDSCYIEEIVNPKLKPNDNRKSKEPYKD